MSNEGKKVKTHYKGTLDDGTQFDSSYDRGEPLEFTCMAGQMIPGFDKAVRDMEVGETKGRFASNPPRHMASTTQRRAEDAAPRMSPRRSAAYRTDHLPALGQFGRPSPHASWK